MTVPTPIPITSDRERDTMYRPPLHRTIAAVAAALALAGCGATETGHGAGARQAVDPQDCAELAAVPAAAGAPVLAVVVDHTASMRPSAVGPALRAALEQAQAEQGVLVAVAVDGADAPPRRLTEGLALDPAPDVQSDQADAARSLSLACVEDLLAGAGADPTAPGSDIVAAINEVAQLRPARLVVDSDGIATAGALDLNAVGIDADAEQVAQQLARGPLSDDLTDTAVTWTGMGRTVATLPEEARDNLERIWVTALTEVGVPADRLVIDHSATSDRPAPDRDLPADPVEAPEAGSVTVGGATTFTVPDALLFGPGSADLRPDADAALRPIADLLATDPGRHAEVIGHSADYGDLAYQSAISMDRAAAVRDRLVELGADRQRVDSRGVGNTEPAAVEWVDGEHDLAAAATNRRVVVVVRT